MATRQFFMPSNICMFTYKRHCLQREKKIGDYLFFFYQNGHNTAILQVLAEVIGLVSRYKSRQETAVIQFIILFSFQKRSMKELIPFPQALFSSFHPIVETPPPYNGPIHYLFSRTLSQVYIFGSAFTTHLSQRSVREKARADLSMDLTPNSRYIRIRTNNIVNRWK